MLEGDVIGDAFNDAGGAYTVGRDDEVVEAGPFVVNPPTLGALPPSLATPSA
jgi:hypothetical protein